jgi:hypothetical protein
MTVEIIKDLKQCMVFEQSEKTRGFVMNITINGQQIGDVDKFKWVF